MEKTGLREGALFEVFSLNTVARSFRPPCSYRENVGWTGPKSERNRGLFPLPPDPVAGILEDHADRRESVANSIRGREVLSLAGVLAECNNQVEKAVHEVRALRSRLEEERIHVGLSELRGALIGPMVAEGFGLALALPRDHPAFHQVLQEGRDAVYASAWAISASWCGNISSVAPPWRSYCDPKCRIVIAVSSMCHPGRPLPHGLSPPGSPGFWALQSTKSPGGLFRSSMAIPAPAPRASTFCPLSLPQPENVVVS